MHGTNPELGKLPLGADGRQGHRPEEGVPILASAFCTMVIYWAPAMHHILQMEELELGEVKPLVPSPTWKELALVLTLLVWLPQSPLGNCPPKQPPAPEWGRATCKVTPLSRGCPLPSFPANMVQHMLALPVWLPGDGTISKLLICTRNQKTEASTPQTSAEPE